MDNAEWDWISAGLAALSDKYDPLGSELISGHKLRLAFNDNKLDRIDVYSAALLSAALDRGKSTLFVLPDGRERRPAFLFAYTLLNTWWRSRDLPVRHKVLYCGATPGVRDQLGRVRISGVRLESVFEQTDLARGSLAFERNKRDNPGNAQLPEVITAYAPADANLLLSQLRPRFIAIDCDDASTLPWLGELLEAARQHKTSVVGWVINPLSDVIEVFRPFGHVAQWPFGWGTDGDAEFGVEDPPEVLFQPFTVTQVHPLLISDGGDSSYSSALGRASSSLRNVRKRGLSSYETVALQEHWKLYRGIETLHIPLAIHEAEASSFWGLSALDRQLGICIRFQEILESRERNSAPEFGTATEALADALEWLQTNDPPLWTALSELVQTPSTNDSVRLITFQNHSKKSLFQFALLARLNLTDADIRPNGNWIVTLADLRRSARNHSGLRGLEDGGRIPGRMAAMPILVGLPSARLQPKLWPVFLADEVSILAHSFQQRSVAYRTSAWSDALSVNLPALCRAIAELAAFPPLDRVPTLNRRVDLSSPVVVAGVDDAHGSSSKIYGAQPLWIGPDLEDEMGWLFDDAEDSDLGHTAVDTPDTQDDSELWSETAIELVFGSGWRGLFEPSSKLNFIDRVAARFEERYVQALRPGDWALLMPFQRRQSLYELVVSRVHAHPAIQLHLALLARWHSDLMRGFQSWSKTVRGQLKGVSPIAALLSELQRKGCKLSSPLAIHFWITGATLCPLDTQDIRRAAEVLDLDFVASEYRKIGQAASRIRGLHRGLSNRLNHWLAERAQGISNSHDQEIIDEETRLTFGEIRDSFVVSQIVSSRLLPGPFLRSTLGTVRRTSDDGSV